MTFFYKVMSLFGNDVKCSRSVRIGDKMWKGDNLYIISFLEII
jgi:hypothetical protein